MKRLHRKDLYGWSVFNERLNIDFNSFVWARGSAGNIVVDPLVLSEHDLVHLRELGGVAWVVLTNSDHARATESLIKAFGAKVAGPAAEKSDFPLTCDRWLSDGEEFVPGLRAFEFQGSKTPGELGLILEENTFISGDLIRSHRADSLMMLSTEQGLVDQKLATQSLERLLALGPFRALLLGDGFCVFRDGHTYLRELSANLAR
jgi:glyoxylase-like metal-dependent hydrolase (beta-lactamase superfamily II)